MKKTILVSLLACSLFMSPAFAEEESPASICAAEANDAGFENASEKEAYIADCIEQVTQDNRENESPRTAMESN